MTEVGKDGGSRIEDYALVGDTRTAALVGRDGSVDWLCLPRFDGGACFARLLGGDGNGFWRIAPATEWRSARRYRGATPILETTFTTAAGSFRVVDGMAGGSGGRVHLVRLVEGIDGAVPVEMRLVLRFDYGRIVPWVRARSWGLQAVAGPDAVTVESPVAMHGEDFTTVARFTVLPGERIPFLLTWRPSHRPERVGRDPVRLLGNAARAWQGWADRLDYDGPWREAVQRSLVTLKALTYHPTGGIVAAPTTSLPEVLGGARNWDYRFCWIRDATFTLLSLLRCGYTEEAKAWREWLLRAAAGRPSELQIMYGIAGERRLPETEAQWLPGFAGSAPVRLGNAAHAQLQLDVYGELMDALHMARRHGLEPDNEAWRVQEQLVDFLEGHWQEQDQSIWETRGPPRDFTYSKVMAWVGIDRSIAAVEKFGFKGPLERWRALRQRIHDDVCARGWSEGKQSFVQSYGSEELDAALLQVPLVGFLPASDPRVRGTVAAIERELVEEGLVLRYRTESGVDGLDDREGAFLACSFWLVDNYVLADRRVDAERLFERLLALRNDVGLLAEEYDPRGKRQLGNFPQAFSHVALVNSALNLSQARGPAHERSEGTKAAVEDDVRG